MIVNLASICKYICLRDLSMNYKMISGTMAAHFKYDTPSVFMTFVIEKYDGQVLIPKLKGDKDEIHLFPCTFNLSCDQTADILMAMYGMPDKYYKNKKITLISNQQLFQGYYVYLFIVSIKMTYSNYLFLKQKYEFLPINKVKIKSPLTGKLVKYMDHVSLQDNCDISHLPELKCRTNNIKKKNTLLIKKELLCMPLITVNGIVYHVNESGSIKSLILVKRSKIVSREPNKWCLPSGFVQSHESAPQALAREMREELNLRLNNSEISNYLFTLPPSRKEKEWINWSIYYIVKTKSNPQKYWHTPNEEIEEVRAFKLNNMPNSREMAFDHYAVIQRALKDFKKY
jgi:ADP-ribose pyrophosphatase YjhB (NUDIX family)